MKKFFSVIMAFVLSLSFMPSPSAKVLDIVLEGNPILRKQSSNVERFDSELSELLDNMKETMKHAGGCGLAAPQIGKNINVFVADTGKGVQEYINPVITQRIGEQTGPEGCLSIPGYTGTVTRPKTVTGTAYNRNGEQFEFTANGFSAQVICHEYDHLIGVLYTDKAILIVSNKIVNTTCLVGATIGLAGSALILCHLFCGLYHHFTK